MVEDEFTEYRDYARIDDGDVVIVNHALMSVLEDLVRERGRKTERDEAIQTNQEAIEQARETEP